MTRTPSVGIVDWGIGGIGVFKRVRSRYPDVAITYFSDAGAAPYGTMSRQALVSRLHRVIAYLRSHGTSHLLLACNAASTVLPLLDVGQLPVVGVIESAVRATVRHRPERLALIGGARTVRSGVYQKAFADLGIPLTQRIAQPLSGLIECGDTSSQFLRDECARILHPVRDCSHLLLACTHYPAIGPLLKEIVSAETVLIDPAEELVSSIARWVLPTGGTVRFVTTGNAEIMRTAARNAFGVEFDRVQRMTV